MPSSNPSENREGEINLKKSFFRFIFSFGLCVSLGLISGFFIDRHPLEEELLKKLNIFKSYEMEISETKFRFRRGLIPVVAVAVGKLELKKKNCFIKSLVARDILVVFKPFLLLFGKFEPKKIHINDLEFNQSRSCFFPEALNSEEVEFQKSNDPSSGKALFKEETGRKGSEISSLKKTWEKIKESHLRIFFSKTSEILQSIQQNSYQPVLLKIYKLKLKWIQDMNRQAVLKARFFAEFGSSIDGQLVLSQLKVENKKIPIKSNVLFSLDSDGINMEMKTDLREGKVQGRFKVLNKPSFLTSMDFRINRFPVSFFDDFIKTSFHYLWFNCSGQLLAKWENLSQKNFDFNHCGLTGPYGHLTFFDIQTRFLSIISSRVKIVDLDLDKILKERKAFQISGVFENYGILSAEGIYFLEGNSQFQGFLKESRILFSKNHFRDLQSISKILFQIKGDKNKWEVTVPDMNIKGGDFRGEFKFEVDESGRQISGKMNVPKIQLSPAIYKLILDSEPSPFKLSGRFQWSKGRMEDWFIDVKNSYLKSNTYKLYKFNAQGYPKSSGTSFIEINVPRGEVSPDSKWVHWLKPTTLDKIQTNRSLKFRNFVLQFKLFKDQSLQWGNGSFFLENGWRFSSQGSRDFQRQLKALIQWFQPNTKVSFDWLYQGELFKGHWQARSAWIDKWLMEHESFLKKHSDIKILASPGKDKGDKNTAFED